VQATLPAAGVGGTLYRGVDGVHGDGETDLADLGILLAHWGEGRP
jgi:hypothetical protein